MREHTSKQDLGWSNEFESTFAQLTTNLKDSMPGRITREDRGQYRVQIENQTLAAEITGSFRHSHQTAEEFPAVGDWIVATRVANEEKLLIHAVLPRRTVFKRTQSGNTSSEQVVAANIDTIFIVTGVDGDFNPRRAERYIAMVYESGAQPVIVLSKSDLTTSTEEYVCTMEDVAIGVPVHAVSSHTESGMELLQQYLGPGKTVACLGSSGSGKSTLINTLIGEELLATGDVREDDSRGRHTSTHRQLVLLRDGGAIIDTPGMRELQLTGNEQSVDAAFEDVEQIMSNCRFNDCGHTNEPGCAVLRALEEGELDEARLKSYQKLQNELAYTQRRQSESSAHDERQHQKSLHKMYKRVQIQKKRF